MLVKRRVVVPGVRPPAHEAFWLAVLAMALSACFGTKDDVSPQASAAALTDAAAQRFIPVPGLHEPLVAMRPTTAAEDSAVRQAVQEFGKLGAAQTGLEGSIAPLERFVRAYPHSGWSASVLTDLGLAYYHLGYFSRTLASLRAAWDDGRDVTEPT
jgi:hypothetical protein